MSNSGSWGPNSPTGELHPIAQLIWGATQKAVKPTEAAKSLVKLPNVKPTAQEYRWSASQVDTFRDCRRKWAWDKIARIPRKSNKYAAAGSRLHTKLELYLTKGTIGDHKLDPDVLIIMPGMKHLPPPGKAEVELFFILDLGELGTMVGYIDAHFVADDGVPVNIDHKSTGDMRWALKKEELKKNTQSVIYAVYALEKHQVSMIRNRWIYYLRNPKKPRAKKIEVEMHLAEVANLWDGVLVDIRAMKAIHDSGVPAVEVEYNAQACEKYGGCPYRAPEGPCKLSQRDRLRSFVMHQSMKDRIKAAQADKLSVPTAVSPAPAAAPAPRLVTPAEAVTATLPLPGTAAPAVNPPESANPLARLKAQTQGAAPAPEMPPAATVPENPPPAPAGAVLPTLEEMEAKAAAPVVAAVPPATIPPAVLVPAINSMLQAQTAAAATPILPDITDVPAARGTATPSFTLYVNCAPIKTYRTVTPFTKLLALAHDQIREAHGGVSHYRLIPDTYGGAAGILQEHLHQILMRTPVEVITINDSTPEGSDAYSLLEELADEVIRG